MVRFSKLFKKYSHRSVSARDVELEDLESSRLVPSPPKKRSSATCSYPWDEILEWSLDTRSHQFGSTHFNDSKIEEIKALVDRHLNNALEFLHVEIDEDVLGESFDFDQEPKFVSWAQNLLFQNPVLQRTRYFLVPRHIKETNFWKHFFLLVRQTVVEEASLMEPARREEP